MCYKVKMDNPLILDFETTGLIPKGVTLSRYTCKFFPRIVQAAWHFENEIKNYYVKPDGFIIPQESINIHGVTNEIAKEKGIGIKQLLKFITDDIFNCSSAVAHNADFDINVLKSELMRSGMFDELEKLNSVNVFCTMKGSIDYCAIKNPSKYHDDYKWPKLAELYLKCTGKKIENAHDAQYDVLATVECLEKLKRDGII
jgi:DNA polymerase III epsilon subunit-like protein